MLLAVATVTVIHVFGSKSVWNKSGLCAVTVRLVLMQLMYTGNCATSYIRCATKQPIGLHVCGMHGCRMLKMHHCCREKLRQLELLAKQSSGKAGSAKRGSADMPLQLNQDLVAAKVQLDNQLRRMELSDNEKDRLNTTLRETQVNQACLPRNAFAAAGCYLKSTAECDASIELRRVTVPCLQVSC